MVLAFNPNPIPYSADVDTENTKTYPTLADAQKVAIPVGKLVYIAGEDVLYIKRIAGLFPVVISE